MWKIASGIVVLKQASPCSNLNSVSVHYLVILQSDLDVIFAIKLTWEGGIAVLQVKKGTDVPPGYDPTSASKPKTKAAKKNEKRKEKKQQQQVIVLSSLHLGSSAVLEPKKSVEL